MAAKHSAHSAFWKRALRASIGPVRVDRVLGAKTMPRGYSFASQWRSNEAYKAATPEPNPLADYFRAHKTGPGIWKWEHYFDIYHRHFARFRHREVHLLEIGIYSGGSLNMWQQYFGTECRIYGVDIEPACRTYESDAVRVFIGDQQDRAFWQVFKKEVPRVDIVIDDGGHQVEQQIATLEELLPHLQPGGVFLCEDLYGAYNRFASYVGGLALQLNTADVTSADLDSFERRSVVKPSAFQSAIHSVHCYPFATVIEKHEQSPSELVAPKRGTQWQPFLR
jgi:methyltransferase family protein